LNDLSAELSLESHPLPIALLGVNGIGLEVGNPLATAGRTIPWLQDVAAEDVWTKWAITYRDVVVLDGENRKVGVYNLTVHDLGDAANYAELKQMLVDAAEGKLAPLP
jgi:hypothetical protein